MGAVHDDDGTPEADTPHAGHCLGMQLVHQLWGGVEMGDMRPTNLKPGKALKRRQKCLTQL